MSQYLQHYGLIGCLLCSLLVTDAAMAYRDNGNDDLITEMRREIASLRSEVAELRAANQDNWLTEQRAEEIRGIVHDVLADADTRASLLSSGMTAGWDNGFKIGSADGNYSLQISGRVAARYVYNFRSSPAGPPAASNTDRHRSGFEIRRARMAFSGHIVDPSWRYQVQAEFNRSGGVATLLDAYIDKRFDNGWMLRIGQFRPRIFLEDSTSSARQLAVERSLVNAAFATGNAQGVELHVPIGDKIRLSAGFLDGVPSTTGFMGSGANTSALARTTEWTLVGRCEYLITGNWRQFREFTSWVGDDFAMMVGLGMIWQRDEYGTLGASITEVFRWTADMSVKFGGANLALIVVGNHEDTKGAGGGSADQYGVVVQGGVFVIPDEWEVFGRYEWGTLDGAPSSALPLKDLSVMTIGFNRYFAKHNIKWTTDIGFGFNAVTGRFASSGAGYIADSASDSGQFVFRSQLQLAF